MSQESTTIKPKWKTTSGTPQLEVGSVHLWAIPLVDDPDTLHLARSVFAADERDRAERYRFELVRSRFVSARFALRRLLAGYVATHPRDVSFVEDELGKPSLDPALHGNEIRFNLSHSADLAILAVALREELGVDVEHRHDVSQAAEISQRYFHPTEAAEVLGYTGDAQQAAFFRCWTRKEAVIKALGAGLQFPLPEFCVPVNNDQAGWCEYPESRHAPAGRCWLQPFEPCDTYLGALATFAVPSDIQYHTFAF